MNLREVIERTLELIRPACQLIEIAGSIRREAETFKDVEMVCLPKRSPEHLADHINSLCYEGVLAYDQDTRRNGDKYKRLLILDPSCHRMHNDLVMEIPGTQPHVKSLIALDLFIAEPRNFGNLLAIRTGSWEFSRALMTVAKMRGLQHENGYLMEDGKVISCPTEERFFRELGIDTFIAPRDRTVEEGARLIRDAIISHGRK